MTYPEKQTENIKPVYSDRNHQTFNNGYSLSDGSNSKISATTISTLTPKFLDYAQFEEDKMITTIEKYRDCLRACIKHVGDLDVEEINSETLIRLRKQLRQADIKERREASILNTLRVFLRYCQDQLGLEVMDYKSIKPPKAPKRVPEYLTKEEIKKFVKIIKLTNWDSKTNLPGLRFRTLVELLLSTGVRISEALNIKIADIDFTEAEIIIFGKGRKERIVYLTPTAIEWLHRYLKERGSDSEYLFVTRDGVKLEVHNLWRYFQGYRKLAGINKKVTAHTFRRTNASTMMNNGADILSVSQLLGHADINTTIKYYIGNSQKRLKETHQKYLNYNS